MNWYKRLTTREQLALQALPCETDVTPPTSNTILTRLQEIENAIEANSIAGYPYGLGTSVGRFYLSTPDKLAFYCDHIKKIEINKKGVLIYLKTLPNFYLSDETVGNLTDGFIDTDKYYFCSSLQAAKKLQGVNNANH